MVWFFERGFEILTCEARKGEAAYELVIRRPDGTESVQSLNTASQLLEQIAVVPQALCLDGWRPSQVSAADPNY